MRRYLFRGFGAMTLIGATLALSGCWASGDTTFLDSELVITHAWTQRIVYECNQAHPGDSNGRAACALDVVRVLCVRSPVPNFSECNYATDHRYIPDMKAAISEIYGGRDCLYYDDPHWTGIDSWYTLNLGDASLGGTKCVKQ
jgi:hypothetical protein